MPSLEINLSVCPPDLGFPITTKLINGYLSFAIAIALRVKSSPFKGTSALAVVINLNGFFEIIRFGLNIPVSIPFGIT